MNIRIVRAEIYLKEDNVYNQTIMKGLELIDYVGLIPDEVL